MKENSVPTAVVLKVFSVCIALVSVAQLALYWFMAKPTLPELVPAAGFMAAGLLLAVLLRALAAVLAFLAGMAWNLQAVKIHAEDLRPVRTGIDEAVNKLEDVRKDISGLAGRMEGVAHAVERLHALERSAANLEKAVAALHAAAERNVFAAERSAASLERGTVCLDGVPVLKDNLARIETDLKDLKGFFSRIEQHLDLHQK